MTGCRPAVWVLGLLLGLGGHLLGHGLGRVAQVLANSVFCFAQGRGGSGRAR